MAYALDEAETVIESAVGALRAPADADRREMALVYLESWLIGYRQQAARLNADERGPTEACPYPRLHASDCDCRGEAGDR
jgi:hypothetical protein